MENRNETHYLFPATSEEGMENRNGTQYCLTGRFPATGEEGMKNRNGMRG